MFRFEKNRKWKTTLPIRVIAVFLLFLAVSASAYGGDLKVDRHRQSDDATNVSISAMQARKKPPSSLRKALETQMFASRFYGPYAPSVRDGLNEMVIQTSLAAKGLEITTIAPLERQALLSAIPSHLPAIGYISSQFGPRRSPFSGTVIHHKGVDISVNYGASVFATADGVVTYAGWRRAYGRVVTITHGYGIVTRYAHNSALLVKTGDSVRRGDVIAKAGSTGRSTGPHVHYEVWINGRVIDPTTFMFDVPSERRDVIPQVALAQLTSAQIGGQHGRQTVLTADDPAAMGGEGDGLLADDLGDEPIARLWPQPKAEHTLKSAAIFSIFAALTLMIVWQAWPRVD